VETAVLGCPVERSSTVFSRQTTTKTGPINAGTLQRPPIRSIFPRMTVVKQIVIDDIGSQRDLMSEIPRTQL
jgi:hypothetical protein